MSLVKLGLYVLVAVAAVGCAGVSRERVVFDRSDGGETAFVAGHRFYPRGSDDPISTDELLGAIAWSDVVLIGEDHDSGSDHALQLGILDIVYTNFDNGALSLEQLERNEQEYLDEYLAGDLGKAELVKKTDSANWAGEGSWDKWYQPLIDLSRQYGAPVVASNAPRKYSKLAYKEGYAALGALSAQEQALFAFPISEKDRAYKRSFLKMVGGHGDLGAEALDRMYDAQRIWDATMAESILAEVRNGHRVVHMAGRFHVENDGGIVLELLARYPNLSILTLATGVDARTDLIATRD